MLMVKGTVYKNMSQVPEHEDLYGTLLTENLIGVVHDHYVTFYLDMDVDGPENSFVDVHIVKQETGAGESPRKSYLRVERRVAKTEEDARIKLKLYDPSEFHVVNAKRTSSVGNPTGYKIVPGATAASLLDLDDPPQERAAFTNNQVRACICIYIQMHAYIYCVYICAHFLSLSLIVLHKIIVKRTKFGRKTYELDHKLVI